MSDHPSGPAGKDGPLEGGCDCGEIRYRVTRAPMTVHCCHCHWCQRESGSAFALNAMVEAEHVELLQGALEAVDTPADGVPGPLLLLPLAIRGRVLGLARIHPEGEPAASARTGELLCAALSAALRNTLLYGSLLEAVDDVAAARRTSGG